MKSLRLTAYSLMLTLCISNFIGCAAIQETTKGILGVSTKQLEDTRKNALVKTFPYDYKTCSDKVERVLSKIGAYVYARSAQKKMVAIYITREDTTPVGIFFKEMDATHTQIEVSSPSSYGKEFIAKKIFSSLEKLSKPEQEEGKLNEKETPQSK